MSAISGHLAQSGLIIIVPVVIFVVVPPTGVHVLFDFLQGDGEDEGGTGLEKAVSYYIEERRLPTRAINTPARKRTISKPKMLMMNPATPQPRGFFVIPTIENINPRSHTIHLATGTVLENTAIMDRMNPAMPMPFLSASVLA